MPENRKPGRPWGAACALAREVLRAGGLALLTACTMMLVSPNAARALTPTATTVGSSTNNVSAFGQSVTFTATVTGLGGAPTGTVTFLDSGSPIGTGILDIGTGTATVTTSALAVGSHTITASYNGDANFDLSSGTLTQTVIQAVTQTTLVSSANPSALGQTVTFTATVSAAGGGAGTPTGTVTFTVDGTPSTATLSGGVATLSASALAVGSHAITASYGGDANFDGTSNTITISLTQLVSTIATSTTLVSSQNPSNLDQPVTFTATVTPSGPGVPPGSASGNVTFKDGATSLGTGTLNGSGVATFSTSSLSAGSHNITAVYGGDANFSGSTSGTLAQTVNTLGTTTALTSSQNPSIFGQSVTFTATISGGGSGTPTGSVTFKDGATTLGTGTLNASGTATVSTSSLGVGTHSITAIYSGDVSFSSSTSAALTQAVNKTGTKTTLAANPNPSAAGQVVTFTATVTPAAGAGAPTGTITFKDGATTLGTGTLASGRASLATASLALGSHSITAVYGGDANFSTSTSAVLTQAVNVPADSLKLRALQLEVTKLEAQGSGEATSGVIGTAIADGFTESSPLINANESGVHFNFMGEAPQQEKNMTFAERAGDAFAGLGYAAPAAPLAKAPPPAAAPQWLAWADVRGSSWSTSQQTGDIRGGQTNGFAGLTRKLSSDFLIGVFGGGESFDYTSELLNGHLKGGGWTAGGYLGWRLLPGVRFEAGGSYSGIGYDGFSGSASGSFPGRRWLATAALVGTNKVGPGFELESSARVYGLWEHETAYTDSLGTLQAERSFSTGRASAGTKVSYPWMWSSTWMLIPYVGGYADYYFNTDDATLPTATSLVLPTQFIHGLSARFTSGLGLRMDSGPQLSVGGELGGLGSNQFTTWTVQGRASLPF